jgi:hypothetical protein
MQTLIRLKIEKLIEDNQEYFLVGGGVSLAAIVLHPHDNRYI